MRRIAKLLIGILLTLNIYGSFEEKPHLSGSFSKEFSEKASNKNYRYIAEDGMEEDIDGDGYIEGIIYSTDNKGEKNDVFIIRNEKNIIKVLGKIDYDRKYRVKRAEFKDNKYIFLILKNSRDEIITNYYIIDKNKISDIDKINIKNNKENSKNYEINLIESETEKELINFEFYSGKIYYRKNREIKREIKYKNLKNIFSYPDSADESTRFFLESVILNIPKDINFLSENRAALDKKILKYISNVPKDNIELYFKLIKVYGLRGKAVFRVDFTYGEKIQSYFITLNNRTGRWRVEEISVKKPFLTSSD